MRTEIRTGAVLVERTYVSLFERPVSLKPAFARVLSPIIYRARVWQRPCHRSRQTRHFSAGERLSSATMVATDGPGAPTSQKSPSRGLLVELAVESLAHGTGMGVSRLQLSENESFVVLVHNAIPGERVRARIIRRKRNHAEAIVVERLDPPSMFATAPLCRHFLEGCGGCKFQNLIYTKQLSEKEEQVRDMYRALLRRLETDGLASEASVEFLPAVGATVPTGLYAYRNKMDFTFGTRVWRPKPNTADDSGKVTLRQGRDTSTRDENTVSSGRKRPGTDTAPESGEDMRTGFALGLHVPRRYDKVLCIEDCALQIDVANEILRFVERHCRPLAETLLPPYDLVEHVGFLRNLVIRTAQDRHNQTQVMVNLVTSPPADAHQQAALEDVAAALWKAFGETNRGLVCVLQNITSNRSGVAVGESQRRLAGTQDTIEQCLRPLRHVRSRIQTNSWSETGINFQISANSFFQTNPAQAERLMAVVLENSGLLEQPSVGQVSPAAESSAELAVSSPQASQDTGALVVDLFCGTGTIALCLAPFAEQVLGLELVASAVDDARTNARLNARTNTVFQVTDLEKENLWQVIFRHLPLARQHPVDLLVMDPPRAGVPPRHRKAIAGAPPALRPRRLVYVSCNPASQTRDLDLLLRDAPWYRLEKVALVDQFPHTPHIETVAVLSLSHEADANGRHKASGSTEESGRYSI